TVWFMNSVGLNIFIAIVGISAGPGFVNGLRTQGISLFLWGALATTLPLVFGMLIAKYLFRFHDALTLGIVSGARTTTASLGIGGMPQPQGIAGRFEAWLAKHADMPGASFLSAIVPFAVKTFGFEPDAFVHELVDSIIGDNYPVPDRMLVHNERIVHEYLMWAVCGDPVPTGKFDLYAVEGGTAAMCYIFKSLKMNRLLRPGDTIALGTPIFTPYLEMTHLEDYGLNFVTIHAPQENRFQFTDAELK